ncbi:hypothetical protein V6N11_014276 [Hibiscus sabdariffa]|uniref:Uncharacterized protein n=1 Tax=Hibiscus sabdariffa TaxID=183260 RepID=A0ABR1ZU64_9ROSI
MGPCRRAARGRDVPVIINNSKSPTGTPSKTASRDIDNGDGPEEVKSFSKGSNVQRGERWHRFPLLAHRASAVPAIKPSMAKYPTQQASQAKHKASHVVANKTLVPCILYAGRCTSRNNKGIGTKRALHITV